MRRDEGEGDTGGCMFPAFRCILWSWDVEAFRMAGMVMERWRPWMWSVVAWTVFGLADGFETMATMHSEGMHHRWIMVLAVSVLDWVPWMVATPLIMRLAARVGSLRWRSVTWWLAHVPACAAVGLAFCMWVVRLERSFNRYDHKGPWDPYWKTVRAQMMEDTFFFLILYGVVLVVDTVLDSRAKLARQEAEAARLREMLSVAQIEAMRRQVEPHFLFNTLNAVSALVREQRNEAAVDTIAMLSDFLRRLLEDSGRQEVSLADEMEFARRYLEIQSVRFADRLRVEMNVPAETLAIAVPALMVQMLAENAIKHGTAKLAHGGTIRIVASRDAGRLSLRVWNDGPVLSETCEGTGIGLKNLRSRLQGLYGEVFELRLENLQTGGVEACVVLPAREAAQ